MPIIAQPTLIRLTGQTSITATPIPVTKRGDTSSAGTTFTAIAVTDSAAWDLSTITEGDVVVSSDGYKAIVKSVDDASDILTVDGWMPPSGLTPDPRVVAQKPTDGETVTIHQISRAKRLKILALSGNSQIVYVGLDETARITDYPLAAGTDISLEDGEYMDITRVYARSASGTQTISFIVGGGR